MSLYGLIYKDVFPDFKTFFIDQFYE